MINPCNFHGDSIRADSPVSQHDARGDASTLSIRDSTGTGNAAYHHPQPRSELELDLDNDFFESKFSIPKEMSEDLVQALKHLSLLANNMIKERKTPLALETSLSQPIVLSEDEHLFLTLFKKLLDKSLEAREYQDQHHHIDKTDIGVDSLKYVDERLLDILEEEANIQASFLNIVKKLISFNYYDVVIDRLDRQIFKLDFNEEGDTPEEQLVNLYKMISGEIDKENFIDKAVQIEIPGRGHFIMSKSPVISDEPSRFFISYFKQKPALDLYVKGKLEPDLEMQVAPIYSEDSPNDPLRAKAFNANGNALKLFEAVFQGEPRDITSA
jgi:hypothetical protein